LGLWLDRRTGWTPWGILFGVTTGINLATGFVVILIFSRYRLLAPPDDSTDKEMP
jgi:Co/Zn/Cd efflux system component